MSDFYFNMVMSLFISFFTVMWIRSVRKIFKKHPSVKNDKSEKLDDLLMCACAGLDVYFYSHQATQAFLAKATPRRRKALQRKIDMLCGLSCTGNTLYFRFAKNDLKALKGTADAGLMLTLIIDLSLDGDFDEEEYLKLEQYAKSLGLDIDNYL